MKISICIPSYEANGNGVNLIKNAIDSVFKQTYKNFEIVISDHSIDDEIQNYIFSLNNNNIFYLRNKNDIGSPANNSNNAIRNSSGDFIKILNMDDYFSNEKSLETYMINLKNNHKWLLSSTKLVHLKTQNIVREHPAYILGDGVHLLKGINTIGCPSVGIFPREFYFDTEVKYMIDCELWYRLYKTLGVPFIDNQTPMCIGVGEHQLTSSLSSKFNDMLNLDIQYCSNKYKL